MLRAVLVLLSLLKLVSCFGYPNMSTERFPDDFLFGIGSSAYQVEGAWNEDGKRESMWDYISHNRPELIADGSNGDVACDSYHKFEEDLELLKNLGVNFYRFSLSWSRILPSGFPNKVNPAAIDYYNGIIDGLLANNITPIVTIFHADLPLPIHQLGGFTNALIVQWFMDYVRVVYENFGDRVKFWITINDPKMVCSYGRTAFKVLGEEVQGIGDYICGHNLLRSHAHAYRLYNDTFRSTQQGKVGLALNCDWYQPAIKDASEDAMAAGRAMQFQCGWYGHPIFSKEGDYPDVMKEFVANRSTEEGFSKSRLPAFDPKEVEFIKGSADFFGLNHYTTYLAAHKAADPIGDPSVEKDTQVEISYDPAWPNSTFNEYKGMPNGLRRLLNWVDKNYDHPDIYVMGNGFADSEPLHDVDRIEYHRGYLSNILDAIYRDGVQVKGYAAWSLLDQFEFYQGYTVNFGMHHVDFSDPDRTRTPKDSAAFYSEVITSRVLPQIE